MLDVLLHFSPSMMLGVAGDGEEEKVTASAGVVVSVSVSVYSYESTGQPRLDFADDAEVSGSGEEEENLDVAIPDLQRQ